MCQMMRIGRNYMGIHFSKIDRGSNDEEKVDYEPDTDTYLTEPDNTCFDGDIEGSSYILDDDPGLEIMGGSLPTSVDPTPAPVYVAWHRLVVSESSDKDDDTSVFPVLVGFGRVVPPNSEPHSGTIKEAKGAIATAQARLEVALHQKEESEHKSTELTKELDLKVV
ncbi:uncharacterized protein A4U43_C02F11350 [Asparagus officinalis]|uniref:Uncharacterized protein n=1 Tax=Asparagus officinalis TaxID=4686 RepID=A0A5P1FHQ3_ASPOF|nr:uncharacterized protein A4U43_C02F11350 [Asparagus officinalis]